MKQTAVEWLVDELLDGKLLMPSLIEQAKEMEKEQFSQTEISDEEIEKQAEKFLFSTTIQKLCWCAGAEWYREQLKNKQ